SSLFGVPCIRGNNQPTLYEKYSTSSYQLHTASGLPDPTQFFNGISNALASWFLVIMTTIASFCGTLLEWTFALELAGGLNTQLNANGVLTSIVSSLGNNLYKPFFVTAVTIAGLYVAWNGLLKRRMTVTLESAGWVLLATSVAAFFLAAPTWAIGSLDSLSLYASKLVLGTVAQVDPQLSSPAYQATYNQDSNTQQYSGLRAAINRYWDIYVYKPWEVAEFGSIDFAEQKAPNGLTYGEWDLQSQSQGDQARQQFETAVLSQMDSNQQPQLKAWFQGQQGSARASLLALALLAAGLATVLLVMIAGSVIIAQLGLVLMTMVAPLFFLVGIHPGAGRQIFVRWGELMLSFMTRRVLYSAFLAVILVFGGVIVGGMSAQSWLLAASLQILFIFVALWSRKRVAQVFT
ncbi:MAG: type IV secretion system protein, partial [Candidatus Dormibacteraceae bacterium]